MKNPLAQIKWFVQGATFHRGWSIRTSVRQLLLSTRLGLRDGQMSPQQYQIAEIGLQPWLTGLQRRCQHKPEFVNAVLHNGPHTSHDERGTVKAERTQFNCVEGSFYLILCVSFL